MSGTEIYKLTKNVYLYGFNSKFLAALLLVLFAVNYPERLVDSMKYIIKCKLPLSK